MTKNCLKCSKEFQTYQSKNQKYCCKRCVGIGRRKRIEKICQYCKKTYFVLYCHADSKFCSHVCYSKNMEGETREPCPQYVKDKISKANSGEGNGMYGKKAWNSGTIGLSKANSGSFKKGHISWCKNKKGIHFSSRTEFKKGEHCSIKTEFKKGHYLSEEAMKKQRATRLLSDKCRGKNNCNWKGGITPLRTIIWKSFQYQAWRLSIFERDKFLCQMPNCNKTERILNAHHIKEFNKIMEENNIKSLKDAINCAELWDIANGITLCKTCHRRIRGKELQYAPLFQQIINLQSS